MLRNILFLERQRGEFDYVIGNPPWVRIHNIDEELRKRISEDYTYCAKAGWKYGSTIAGSKSGFGKQLDLCVPFVERALEQNRKSANVSTKKKHTQKKHRGYDVKSDNRMIEVKGVGESWTTYNWQSLHKTKVACLKRSPNGQRGYATAREKWGQGHENVTLCTQEQTGASVRTGGVGERAAA